MAASWLRVAVLCFCVAGIFAVATKGLAEDSSEKPEPTKEAEPTKKTDPTTLAPAPTTHAPAPTTPAPAPTAPPTCTDGERRANTKDCHKYTECKKGDWKEDACFWFRKFDSVTLKCMWWGATCAK